MKKLYFCIILLLVFNAKAEKLESAWQWDTIKYISDTVILQRNKEEKIFALLDLPTQKFYPIHNLDEDRENRITQVDFSGDQPYLKVKVEFTNGMSRSAWGVVDYKGNWVIKPIDFSVSDIVSRYVIGNSRTGTIEIRDLQNKIIRSFPRDRNCQNNAVDSNVIFSCKNPSEIIRFNSKNDSHLFTEFAFTGNYSNYYSKANVYLLNEQGNTIIYSETKGKIYEFTNYKSVQFHTDNLFEVLSSTGYSEGYYQIEKGRLDLKTGNGVWAAQHGKNCLKWNAILDGVDSIRILDDQANWHDVTEDLTSVCDMPSYVSVAEKTITPLLKPAKTENNLCGYQNAQGDWQIPAEFSVCREFVDQLAIIYYQGIYGVINQQGKWVTEKPVARSFIVKEWDARDVNRTNTGVINKQGQWVLPPMLDETKAFLTDQGVYSCAFKSIEGCYRLNFSGELESVSSQEVAQHAGTKTKAVKFELIEDKIKPIAIDGAWGYQTQTGEWLIEPKYAEADHFNNGVAKVAQLDQDKRLIWGFVDETGRELVTPQYQELQNFYQDVTWFEKDDNWGLINRKGEVLITPQFSDVNPFKSDIAFAHTARWLNSFSNRDVLVNTKGDIIQSDERIPILVDPFQKNAQYARAYDGRRWGFIDRKGKWLASPNYESASPFIGDYAFVSIGDYEYRIEGRKTIWQPPVEEQSSYIIKRIDPLGNYPILKVKLLQGAQETVALLSTVTGQWIHTE